MKEPFLTAVPVLKKLEDAGFEAYFVGGAVRDFLLQKTIHDVDIATSATPEEMKKIFPKTIDVGIEHGTILILYNKNAYEITTFRTESEYVDYRRPKEVAFIRSLKKDIERRDFTINAMAMDINGKIYDFFNGQTSLKEKKIKTVGNPSERFQEDALRMMRAIRFVSQLGFEIEDNTLKALEKLSYLLEKIAVERKRAEFEKLLTGTNRKKAFELMLRTNLNQFLPGIKHKQAELQLFLSYQSESLDLNEIWVLLLVCLGLKGDEFDHFLRSWRLPLKQIKKLHLLMNFLNKRLDREWTKYDLFSADLETVISAEKLYHVLNNICLDTNIHDLTDMYQALPIKQRSQLDVNGSDIKKWFGKSGGPWINECLMKIECAVLENQVENEKTKIKEWLLKCNQK